VDTSGDENDPANIHRRKDVQMDKKILHSVNGAADKLDVGRSTVYGLIAAKKITAVKIGRRTLITDQSIQQLVDDLVAADEDQIEQK
jgi:excisionase family DNA binding protein